MTPDKIWKDKIIYRVIEKGNKFIMGSFKVLEINNDLVKCQCIETGEREKLECYSYEEYPMDAWNKRLQEQYKRLEYLNETYTREYQKYYDLEQAQMEFTTGFSFDQIRS